MSADVPALAGTQEAAQILGVEVPRISRWRELKPPRMPPPVVVIAATPIWLVKDLEVLRDEKVWSGRRPRRLEIVGVAEAAELLGVHKSQVGRWRREGRFPEPLLEKREPGVEWDPAVPERAGLASTPLWWKRDITRFRQARLEAAAG